MLNSISQVQNPLDPVGVSCEQLYQWCLLTKFFLCPIAGLIKSMIKSLAEQRLKEAASIPERELGVVQEHLHVFLESYQRRQLHYLPTGLDLYVARIDTVSPLFDPSADSFPDIEAAN